MANNNKSKSGPSSLPMAGKYPDYVDPSILKSIPEHLHGALQQLLEAGQNSMEEENYRPRLDIPDLNASDLNPQLSLKLILENFSLPVLLVDDMVDILEEAEDEELLEPLHDILKRNLANLKQSINSLSEEDIDMQDDEVYLNLELEELDFLFPLYLAAEREDKAVFPLLLEYLRAASQAESWALRELVIDPAEDQDLIRLVTGIWDGNLKAVTGFLTDFDIPGLVRLDVLEGLHNAWLENMNLDDEGWKQILSACITRDMYQEDRIFYDSACQYAAADGLASLSIQIQETYNPRNLKRRRQEMKDLFTQMQNSRRQTISDYVPVDVHDLAELFQEPLTIMTLIMEGISSGVIDDEFIERMRDEDMSSDELMTDLLLTLHPDDVAEAMVDMFNDFLENATPEDMEQLEQMLMELNEMLEDYDDEDDFDDDDYDDDDGLFWS